MRARPSARIAIAAAAAALLVGAAPVARAEPRPIAGTPAVLDAPAAWTVQTAPEARGLVAAYRGRGGVIAAVTRARAPNADAYRAAARDAYADEIERGLAARVPGYRRTARRLTDQRGTPALDLEARRADGATLRVRVLLFWTYALALAIEVPPGASPADAAAARAAAASFAPAPRPPRAP